MGDLDSEVEVGGGVAVGLASSDSSNACGLSPHWPGSPVVPVSRPRLSAILPM
jgi:hypothetical protein